MNSTLYLLLVNKEKIGTECGVTENIQFNIAGGGSQYHIAVDIKKKSDQKSHPLLYAYILQYELAPTFFRTWTLSLYPSDSEFAM